MGSKVCINSVQITYNLCSTIKSYRTLVGHCQNILNQGRFNEDYDITALCIRSVNMINTGVKKYILKVTRTTKFTITCHCKK